MPATFKRILGMIDDKPLSKMLPKAIRLGQKLGDSELEEWSRLELLGYWDSNEVITEDTVVPTYRTVPGYWVNQYGQRLVFADPKIAFVNEMCLRYGVIELESFSLADGQIACEADEFARILREHLNVDASLFVFSPRIIPQVLEGIRIRLSDLLVAREKRRGGGLDVEAADLTQEEIVEIKPSFYGITVDLRALWRRLQSHGK